MNPAHLATKLADAISKVVPKEFRVYEEQGMVFVTSGQYRAASEVAEIIDQPGDIAELAAITALNALSMVQDYIAEGFKTPWPGTGTSLPLPEVAVDAQEIQLWFELNGEKILEIPLIKW
jgi:hypothetical protein